MYDDWQHDVFPDFRDPYAGYSGERSVSLDRVTHLVLVDGRLVEVWTEPARGTRWQEVADKHDAMFRARRSAPPILPPYERVLQWLQCLVGGPEALDALDDAPLADPEPIDLDAVALPVRRELEEAIRLVEVAGDLFGDDYPAALRRALAAVWQEEPELLTNRPARAVVAGVCWAVGKANDAFYPRGPLRQGDVGRVLGTSGISTPGTQVQRAIVGLRETVDRPFPCPAPDLLVLGRADLLVASTRTSLLRLRDKALAARRAAVLPIEVES